MCRWGTTELVELTVIAELSHNGKERRRTWPIDACIAPIVRALDVAGIVMLGSCCGHGAEEGQIRLRDGRTLIVTGASKNA